jgi:EAL domain-containing protein (putative c-di-GMP-specific phosphodiesterase class I)
VERPEQLESLHVLGCQQIQGFFFSRPLPSAEVEQFLQEQTTDEPVAFPLVPAVVEVAT